MTSTTLFKVKNRLTQFTIKRNEIREREKQGKKKEKKSLKTYQNFNNDTTSTNEKISMRWIQQHQGRSQRVIEVGHTSRPNVSSLICLQTDRMAHYRYCLLPSLMSFDSSRWDLFNSTSGVVTGALVCLWDLYIFFFLLFMSSLSSQITRRTEERWEREKQGRKERKRP